MFNPLDLDGNSSSPAVSPLKLEPPQPVPALSVRIK